MRQKKERPDRPGDLVWWLRRSALNGRTRNTIPFLLLHTCEGVRGSDSPTTRITGSLRFNITNLVEEVTSIGEQLLRRIVSDLYPDAKAVYNHRPDWLKNKHTGHNLELDVYLPELSLAFEFNGKQHDETEQRARDIMKRNLCRRRGVRLYRIWWHQLGRWAKEYKVCQSIVYECEKYTRKARKLNKAAKKKALKELPPLPAKFTGYKRTILPPGPMYYQPKGRGKRRGGGKVYAKPIQWSRPKRKLSKIKGLFK